MSIKDCLAVIGGIAVAVIGGCVAYSAYDSRKAHNRYEMIKAYEENVNAFFDRAIKFVDNRPAESEELEKDLVFLENLAHPCEETLLSILNNGGNLEDTLFTNDEFARIIRMLRSNSKYAAEYVRERHELWRKHMSNRCYRVA